jgi:hypothetical protein
LRVILREAKNPTVSIRTLRDCLLLLTILTASLSSLAAKEDAPASGLTVVRTFTGWRDAASFKRISEYFDGKENTGRQMVLRTHPEERAGYYYQLRLRNPGAAQPVQIKLEVVLPAPLPPNHYVFQADLPAGDQVLLLGLTGADWTDMKANPVAWKLEVLSPDGQLLVTEKSYLWERPSTK